MAREQNHNKTIAPNVRDLFPLDPLEVFLCLSGVPDVKVCRDSTNQCQFDESV